MSLIFRCSQIKAYKSATVGSRFCWPTDSNSGFGGANWIYIVYSDLIDGVILYGICIVVALLLSFAFMKSLEKCPLGTMKFMSTLYLGLSFALGGFLFYQYKKSEPKNNSYLQSAIVVWVITAFVLIAILCSWRRFKLVSMVIQATAEYLGEVKTVKAVPTILFFTILVYLGWSGYAGLHLISIGKPSKSIDSPFGVIERV